MRMPSPENGASIRIENLRFVYDQSGFELAIDELELGSGSRLAVTGPSGCGKTTFLRLVAGIHVPAKGTVRVGHQELSRMNEAARRRFRISTVGFVFQDFELIDYLNAHENILFPYYINSALVLDANVRRRASELANRMGIADKLRRSVTRLSQGERQRVAICRALIAKPCILLCDEPTGNLDPENKSLIIDMLFENAAETGATVVCVTHDHELLPRFEQIMDFPSLRTTE